MLGHGILPTEAYILTAEMTANSKATKYATKIQKTIIYIDALQIVIACVSSHTDIIDNKYVDSIAKEVTRTLLMTTLS